MLLGEDSELGREVAIKIPRRGVTAEPLSQFLQEARRLAQLRHPNIVTVFDVGVQDDLGFIVTEFLRGVSLEDHLQRTKLDWRKSAEVAAKIAEALA